MKKVKTYFFSSQQYHYRTSTMTPILLLLSLDAHSYVDDYSGTLGGVRKSTFQLWSQVLKIKLLCTLSQVHSLSLSQKQTNMVISKYFKWVPETSCYI